MRVFIARHGKTLTQPSPGVPGEGNIEPSGYSACFAFLSAASLGKLPSTDLGFPHAGGARVAFHPSPVAVTADPVCAHVALQPCVTC